MEHQAGAGRSGPAGENTAGDSESNGREPALADAADRTVSDGGGHESGSSAGSQGEPSIAPEPPMAPEPSIAPEAPAAPDLPATGEPRVDAALKLLERLPGLPVSDHPELFEQVHAQLSEVLGELDSGPGPAGG
jgi:hypothetical protein